MLKYVLLLTTNLAVSLAYAATVTPPIYKIEKGGQQAYLLGTIHSGVNFSDLSQSVKDIAVAADSLVVEVDMVAAAPIIGKAFPMGSENSLRNLLTALEWESFYSRLAPQVGSMAAALDQLHPVLANLYYSMSTIPATAEPIDMVLMENAKQARKNIFYLEEPEVQVHALLKTQTIDALKKMLAMPIENLQKQTDFLVNAYVTGDIKALESSFSQMSADEIQVVLIDRNLAWIRDFDGIFATPGKELFAVGAGHLLGEMGLVKLLSNRGYSVTRL